MRFLMFSLIAIGLMVSDASARTWSNASGSQKLNAEYLGFENGMVKLKVADTGIIQTLPPAAFSEADQKFIQEQVARAELERESAAGTLDRFTLAIRENPTDPKLYVQRGLSRRAKKEYNGAIEDFTKALQFTPDNPNIYNARGLAYQGKNDLIAAQRDFNKALELNPELALAYKNRGENLRRLALDKSQSVPELDEAIEKWQMFWNHARKGNLSNTPWQPLNATKGDVSRIAALQQMAKIDLERWEWFNRPGWDGGYGGHGGHGHGCDCAACSGDACAHCDGSGCPACGGGKPAPGLGVYPPQVMKGETVTLVANASQLAKGMPGEAKPGSKRAAANAPKVSVDSVDFYRDVDGDGLFNAENDQYLASDLSGGDGFSVEVSTSEFPPGPQSYFAVPRGGEGSGSGASPEELLEAAKTLEEAAKTQRDIAQSCEAGKSQGMPADQSQGVGSDQSDINNDTGELADKVAGSCPEAAELLEEAAKPMKAVKNLMNTAQRKPGTECAEECDKAAAKASEAADKLAEASQKLQEAYEAAKASAAANPGQAPATAASGAPTSGAGEILAAAPIGARGVGGGDGGDGDDCDDDEWDEEFAEWEEEIIEEYEEIEEDELVEITEEYIEEGDYDNAVIAYDELLADDPDNLVYLRDRAHTQLMRGGYNYAIRDYNHLLEVREPDADLYYNRGCAYLAAARYEEALADFNKSIELNETYSLAYNNRGTTHARMGDFTNAIVDFSKAIEIEPANRLAYRNRALAYKKLGELTKAQRDFEYVLKLESEQPNDGI